jgi:uncharacterized GH25 family protein
MKSKILSTMICAVLLSGSAFAHEYWFEPETFFPALGQKTVVRLYVGDGLIKDREERPFQLAKTTMFQLFSASAQTLNLKTSLVDEALPIYHFSPDRAGNYLLAMERNWSYIKIEPQKFESYLREDGMDYILDERERLGESSKEGRERYSRFIKSLLQVGDKRDETYNKTVGLKLEITPLENPYSKKLGDKLAFQILFDGKPLVGKTAFADNRKGATQKMTTDSEGKVTMKIDRSGLWLVRLVVMQRCTKDCNEADWESFWGAYSFGMK